MKIALTADCHLTTREQHPERYEALENIVAQMAQARIEILVVAGDLFDASSQNYAEFDRLCKSAHGRQIKLIVIPGNHDPRLSLQSFAADNVEILTEPTIRTFSPDGLKFLFLPFCADKTMGEFMAAKSKDLPHDGWVLVGHGDWIEGVPEPNPFEPGVYMPLTRSDIENYRPTKVILGHSHKPFDSACVHYVGSPCGLDIREPGRRRFLIIDAENTTIKSNPVNTKFIYFNESLVVLPLKKEGQYVREKLAGMIQDWQLSEDETSKVRVQLKVRGYSTDKRALLDTIKKDLGRFKFYQNGEPDLAAVSVADDLNRTEIANQVIDWVEKLDWRPRDEQPTTDEILLEALHVIYGE